MKHREEVQKLKQDVLSIAEDARKEFGKLSNAQLNWKPAPERWSVAQCFDHLITTNVAYFPILESIVENKKKTSVMERVPLLPKLWARLFMKSLDPTTTRKLKAPASFQPSSSDLPVSIIDDFAVHQSQVADTMEATKDLDLDRIVITSPALSVITYNVLDAYRILVVHEKRHFQQASRVTNEPTFPGPQLDMPTQKIRQVQAEELESILPDLMELLRDSVADDASVGYLDPIAPEINELYWRDVFAAIRNQTRVLLVSVNSEDQITGTIQLDLATKPNAIHRAEVQKLLVHTSQRKQGVARTLIDALEASARKLHRTLLVLDTLQRSDAETLYKKWGYERVGAIPEFARVNDDSLQPTVIFYKILR